MEKKKKVFFAYIRIKIFTGVKKSDVKKLWKIIIMYEASIFFIFLVDTRYANLGYG